MNLEGIEYITTSWADNSKKLKQVRKMVFVEEQHVPETLEWDEFDSQSTHFLALLDNKPIATARLKPDGQIGRMAVIKNYRGVGIGSKLLSTAISHAETNDYKMIFLHAQKKSVSFYHRFGFINNGTEFMDAGILHQAMYKILTR